MSFKSKDASGSKRKQPECWNDYHKKKEKQERVIMVISAIIILVAFAMAIILV